MTETPGESILKVLSGNQYGAEVALSDGIYSFGSGPEADIQLDDVALQPLHGQVRLRDGKIELRSTQGDLSTASGLTVTRDDEVWHEIAQMDVVTAGLSRFVIGGIGADWSTLVPPATAAARRTQGGPTLGATLRTLPPRAIYGGAGLAAALVLLVLLAGGNGDAAQSAAPAGSAAAVAELRRSVGDLAFATDVQVIQRADGTVAVEGYVEDPVQRRAIQNSVDASGLPATLRVFVRENLRADIQGTIDSMDLPVRFTLDNRGNLALDGTVLDPALAAKLVENIETGVFGLTSVTDRIRTADQILADLQGISEQASLGDLVIFRLDGLVVEATGIVPRAKIDNWVGLIGVYSRRFAKEIPLRSFVTLDEPAAVDTAPVIIGSGPVADAETGRVVAPETLAEPNEVDAQSLFAGQPPAAPDAGPNTQQPASAAPAGADQRLSGLAPSPRAGEIRTALARLQELRPDLYAALVTPLGSGQTPDPAILREALDALGGSLQPAGPDAPDPQAIEVTIPGIGRLGSVEELTTDLRDYVERTATPASAAQPQSASLPAIIAAPDTAIPQTLVLTPEQPAPLPTPTPAQAEARAGSTQPTPASDTSDTAPAVPAPGPQQQPAPAPSTPVAPSQVATGQSASPPPQTAGTNDPARTTPGTDAPKVTELPVFALPAKASEVLRPMLDAAEAIIAREDSTAPAEAAMVSPNLRALVAMQQEQLSFGKTLMKLPQPLSALPYPVEESATCWSGSVLTPEMVPTVLLLLDSLSLSTRTDVSAIDPGLRDLVMETALSPGRVTDCLARTGSDFAAMVNNSSTFLFESARNPDFVEFLFRNVPRGTLTIAGVNLLSDRYVELVDGRKLREGSAPDVTSRILSIGDLGLLLRTADGTQVQLYGNRIGWRVAEGCVTPECRVTP